MLPAPCPERQRSKWSAKLSATTRFLRRSAPAAWARLYRARDTKLERDVAIKVLPDDLAADPDRLARFEREAKLLAALSHTNIGAIHGLEESDGVRFLVLELIEGESLERRLQRGAIPVPEALDIARQIAEALEAAHDAGFARVALGPNTGLTVSPDGRFILYAGRANVGSDLRLVKSLGVSR